MQTCVFGGQQVYDVQLQLLANALIGCRLDGQQCVQVTFDRKHMSVINLIWDNDTVSVCKSQVVSIGGQKLIVFDTVFTNPTLVTSILFKVAADRKRANDHKQTVDDNNRWRLEHGMPLLSFEESLLPVKTPDIDPPQDYADEENDKISDMLRQQEMFDAIQKAEYGSPRTLRRRIREAQGLSGMDMTTTTAVTPPRVNAAIHRTTSNNSMSSGQLAPPPHLGFTRDSNRPPPPRYHVNPFNREPLFDNEDDVFPEEEDEGKNQETDE